MIKGSLLLSVTVKHFQTKKLSRYGQNLTVLGDK